MNALIRKISGYWRSDVRQPGGDKLQVGEYKADYSALAAKDLTDEDPELTALYERSKPVSR